jgi:hypothetical protein
MYTVTTVRRGTTQQLISFSSVFGALSTLQEEYNHYSNCGYSLISSKELINGFEYEMMKEDSLVVITMTKG